LLRTAWVVGLAFHCIAGLPAQACAQRVERTGEGRTFGAEEIRKTGSQTIWDALRILAPEIRFEESATGQPTRMTRRGSSTVALKDGPLVYVDGVRLTDFRSMTGLPAADVASVQILNGIDGTTLYGTGAVSGVIIIKTKIRDGR
jgi:outer membrane receptor protein involved in Fe transport